MINITPDLLSEIRAELETVIPATWEWRLCKKRNAYVTMRVSSAPINLLEAYKGKRYTTVCSSLHEDEKTEVDRLLNRAWKALHSRNTYTEGQQPPMRYFVEFWIGHWERPFEQTAR